jgi:hypothetical protein
MMALTKRDLELIDQRTQLQAAYTDEAGTGMSRHRAGRQLRALDASLAKPPPPKKKPPAAAPAPAAAPTPAPAAAPTPVTLDSVIGQTGTSPLTNPTIVPEVPTLDDAAARVEATEPMERVATRGVPDPATGPVPYEPKRKRYGVAATTLTGEGGVSRLGGVATRALLG